MYCPYTTPNIHNPPPETEKSSPLPRPPLLVRPISNNTLPPHHIPIPQQRRHIHIQRRLRPRIRQQLLNRHQRRRQRVHGTPVLGGQQGEADLAGAEGDVGVGDARAEMDGWR